MVIAHFNHQLRGRHSAADEQFVRKTAAALRLPIETATADVRAWAGRSGISIEMAARKLRHEFLAAAARHHGINKIALAHHADDQVELFLLRLLRGAGTQGLAGMKWRNPSPADPAVELIRPLLDQPKSVLEKFARDQKIKFRRDASNAQLDYQRNRIRHEVLPLLKKIQPATHRTILRFMEILRADDEFLRAQTARLTSGESIDFEQWPTALQRRWLQNELSRLKIPPEFEWIEHLRQLAGIPLAIAPETLVTRDLAGKLRLIHPKTMDFDPAELVIDLSGDRGQICYGARRIDWKIVAKKGVGLIPRKKREFFDADKVGPRIVLRHWRPGDRFQPIGRKSAGKLQDLFTDLKIPRDERRRLMVAGTGEGEIFWVEGVRISERFKLDKSTTRRLKWCWS